ncbi:PREDICTED: uncharacterized protein LOC104822540 [Tarenaya hassleriana]|uniref:uncharacterized protein LOC104822540 n=1 Tax=Tarenaya hassleriana TaxID=28532 RepID=UPI00053C7008|nr:PREDICTED: uncharacterized protein LOC104822540 [Tarenaya hassleriana]
MAQEEDALNEYSRDLPRKDDDSSLQLVLDQLAALNSKFTSVNLISTTDAPTLSQEDLGMYVVEERTKNLNYMANNNYTNSYNPGWKNHPNLSYKSSNVENPTPNNFRASNNLNQRIPPGFALQSRAPNQNSNYRVPGQSYNNHAPPDNGDLVQDTHALLQQFIQTQEKTIQEFRAQFVNIDAHFKLVDNQIAKLASAIQRPSGSLPPNSETNPLEHVNAITLRSGKQVDTGNPLTVEQSDSSRTTVLDTPDDTPEPAYVPPPPSPPPVPFPSRLRRHNEDIQFAKFVEMLKKLKDILTKKRIVETVPLTTECNALIQHELPLMQFDPGSFSIPCKLDNIFIGRALCDLGVGVSLLPLSIFKKLNVGELKPTGMTLQLADHSVKYPTGILEDAPLKVGNFYIPVDFVVLDMDKDSKVSIILGRPFLNTADAVIHVRAGMLTMKIGDKTVEFTLDKNLKQPSSTESACFINTLDNATQNVKPIISDHGTHRFEHDLNAEVL